MLQFCGPLQEVVFGVPLFDTRHQRARLIPFHPPGEEGHLDGLAQHRDVDTHEDRAQQEGANAAGDGNCGIFIDVPRKAMFEIVPCLLPFWEKFQDVAYLAPNPLEGEVSPTQSELWIPYMYPRTLHNV